ncbi:MAG: CopG family antitoxin [Pyrinomonadaceae bacterium]
MNNQKLPQTDSIQELAQFWDTHDLTEFEGDLEEVSERVFTPRTAIHFDLELREAAALRRIAEAEGVAEEELIRGWVREKIAAN